VESAGGQRLRAGLAVQVDPVELPHPDVPARPVGLVAGVALGPGLALALQPGVDPHKDTLGLGRVLSGAVQRLVGNVYGNVTVS
jgi:hypothetical protein